MGDLPDAEGGFLNERYRDQIAEIIALLHQALRANDADKLAGTMAAVRTKVDTAASLVTTPVHGAVGSDGVPGVLTNNSPPYLAETLERHMAEAREVRLATAFLSADDANPLILPLRKVADRGGKVRILTSLMGAFNRPDALRAFCDWRMPVELRIYTDDLNNPDLLLAESAPAFHAKALLIHKEAGTHLLALGSANFTSAGFGSNVEWNYVSDFEVNAPIGGRSPYGKAVDLFERAWESNGFVPDHDFLDRYEKLYHARSLLMRELRRGLDLERKGNDGAIPELATPAPRPAQAQALQELARLRQMGVKRFAVIAATGIGKTFLSAFEVRNAGADRVLFIAHRASILREALKTFQSVLSDHQTTILQGREAVSQLAAKDQHDPLLAFAMIQTISRPENLPLIEPSSFDYVIIDEFHHAEAASYKAVLDYLTPKHLLGMTATPERMDGQDVLEVCDHRVAYEVRLFEAIERGWLAPFHYYAIFDPTDYEPIRWTGTGYDDTQLQEALSTDTRADLICHNLRLFQPASGKRKCMAFCSNVGHATWMANAFQRRGIPASVIHGDTNEEDRQTILANLQDQEHELEIVCSVDVLNEGIDVPSLTHVLMLRPTQSFTVFFQQLGRGLRLAPGKRYVTVLDFVGSFKKSYVAPLALAGHVAPPSSVKKMPEFHAPKLCHVQADTSVRRVWDQEIKQVFKPASPVERLRLGLEEIAGSDRIGGVALTDLFVLDDVRQHLATIRKAGGWIQVRASLVIQDKYEESLIDTPGEAFLFHVESELNAVRSYKMAVLTCLLKLSNASHPAATTWKVTDIAREYLAYFLQDSDRTADWPALAKHKNAREFPISKAVSELRKNPLSFLSDQGNKFFELTAEEFELKEPIRPFWAQKRFREMVAERVQFAEARYWYRKRKRPDG